MAGRAVIALACLWAAAAASTMTVDAGSTSTVEAGSLDPAASSQTPAHASFVTASTCMVCHNGLVTPAGEDVSIGSDWRASMMANSARDPYWQAAVRREIMDHPDAAAEIEDECSICHMPMSTYQAREAGGLGRVFEQLPIGRVDTPTAWLAADGVSCAACHQITPEGLGTPASFTGGYVVDTTRPAGERAVFGPFEVDAGRTTLMRSAVGFVPTESTHVQSSEFCATCHTLFTSALGPDHQVLGRLPEQMPYLEWQQSVYRDSASCQSCHMPVVEGATPLTQVLGQPREGFSRHSFRGGNFFMQRMLNRYRDELGVEATPQEMGAAIARTVEHLQADTAVVSVERAVVEAGRLLIDVDVRNLAGHKFPTAYPSRRAWLHLTVRDAGGRVVFESGAFEADGRIAGNDNDADASRFEAHHTEITAQDQVQIYEAVMAGSDGAVTTGLLTGVRYLKDNRLLPAGFDKARATPDVAVHGAASADADFRDGGDRVRYAVPVSGAGPFSIAVELWFQPIAFRWADNLRAYDAFETRRFVRYYESMAAVSGLVVARAAGATQ